MWKRNSEKITSAPSTQMSSSTSSLHAFCKLCWKDINITHGGRSDINQCLLFRGKLNYGAFALGVPYLGFQKLAAMLNRDYLF